MCRKFVSMMLCCFMMMSFCFSSLAAERLVSRGQFKITAYCGGSCCNKQWAGKTASGATPRTHHTVAANKKDFPFGIVLVINGEEYVVEDRGVGPGVIDIFYDSHSAANRFGTHYNEVFVKYE